MLVNSDSGTPEIIIRNINFNTQHFVAFFPEVRWMHREDDPQNSEMKFLLRKGDNVNIQWSGSSSIEQGFSSKSSLEHNQ